MKESQRKGFCSRHLSDKKEPKTSRSSSNSRPPSSVASDVTTTPIPPSPHMSTLTAQERDAASVLMSLKNTPSRSATPASGRLSQIFFIKFFNSLYEFVVFNLPFRRLHSAADPGSVLDLAVAGG